MIFIDIAIFLTGFFLLVKGATLFLDGAIMLSKRHHFSEVGMGLGVLAFGTAAPELVVNAISSWNEHSELVFANIIGSNIFNLYLVLGTVGIISPMRIQTRTISKEIPFSIIAFIILFILINDKLLFGEKYDSLTRNEALILLFLLLIFSYFVFRSMLGIEKIVPHDDEKLLGQGKTYLFLIGGMAALFVGGEFVVTKASLLASSIGVSQKLVGIIIVAPGTCLPELATSLAAALKEKHGMAVGNIIGSLVFNVLLVLPLSAFLNPLPYEYSLNFDLYFCFCGLLLLLAAFFTGKIGRIDRWESFFFLFFLALYVSFLFVRK
jgi:cation:H+ antiporter